MDDQTAKLMNPISQASSQPTAFFSQSPNSPPVSPQAVTPPLQVQPQNSLSNSQPINPSTLTSNQPKTYLNIASIISQQNTPEILIRIGLAFVYTYAAISMSLDPDSWSHYLPVILTSYLPAPTLLHLFGAYEIALSIWLLWGKWNLYPSILAALTMFSLTIVNLDSFSVVFRNVSIFFSALALVVLNLRKRIKE